MVPKENGFNQSQTASPDTRADRDVFHARLPWKVINCEVIQRQHFCHHGNTICHTATGNVTTKLHGTYTCGCNNNATFSGRPIFSRVLPSIVVCRPR